MFTFSSYFTNPFKNSEYKEEEISPKWRKHQEMPYFAVTLVMSMAQILTRIKECYKIFSDLPNEMRVVNGRYNGDHELYY